MNHFRAVAKLCQEIQKPTVRTQEQQKSAEFAIGYIDGRYVLAQEILELLSKASKKIASSGGSFDF